MKFGNIEDHNINRDADMLYDPSRTTLDPHYYQASKNVIGATSFVSK
jgi:hypothetical protein